MNQLPLNAVQPRHWARALLQNHDSSWIRVRLPVPTGVSDRFVEVVLERLYMSVEALRAITAVDASGRVSQSIDAPDRPLLDRSAIDPAIYDRADHGATAFLDGDEAESQVVIFMHHMFIDGHGISALLRAASDLANGNPWVPRRQLSYYSGPQLNELADKTIDGWLQRLDAPALGSAFRSLPANHALGWQSVTVRLGHEAMEDVHRQIRRSRTTSAVILMAALNMLLAAYDSDCPPAIESVVSNRTTSGDLDSVACLANDSFILIDPKVKTSSEMLSATAEGHYASLTRGWFDRMKLSALDSTSRYLDMSAVINVLSSPSSSQRAGESGTRYSMEESEPASHFRKPSWEPPNVHLHLGAIVSADTILLSVAVSDALNRSRGARQVALDYLRILDTLLSGRDARLCDLPIDR